MAKKTEQVAAKSADEAAPANGTEAGTANAAARGGNQRKATRRVRRNGRRRTNKTSTTANGEASIRSSGRAQRPFPPRTLEEALAVPQAIREKNNGNEWDSDLVARASANVAKANNKFFYLAAASRDYGLTVGSRDTDKIGLSPLGREIFFAGDEQTARQKKIEAFFSVDIFKKVYEHYGSGKLPEDQYLNNTLLSDFNLQAEFHGDFRRIFEANCKFLGIEEGPGRGAVPTEVTRSEHGADIRIVGEAKGKFDRTAFVIMPFVEKGQPSRSAGFFKEVLTKVITPAANQAGFAVETAEQDGSDVIQSTIINQLLKSDNLVICDLTDHNPNVLFELGIRIAKELPVALIKAEGTGRIFDVDNMMRVLSYSANLWPSTVESDLPKLSKHIKAAWDNRTTGKNYMQILTNAQPSSYVEGKPHGQPASEALTK
ncbi:MAG: hypothetical protein KIT68_11735 [Phycisphaeraceae bacterium]|nr:hypothetical protein [Phycisphaeraceae bacterium]